ncbi:MAG: hypothetical protein LQ351_002523 [Letrouitia transgressa]|nr:MAG: hypothetical protein LQ351_002523 [Letrouitia transgressa]
MTKRKRQQGFYTKRLKGPQEGSNEEVLLADVREVLGKVKRQPDSSPTQMDGDSTQTLSYEPPDRFTEVEVDISSLSSTGDGLGLSSTLDHVYVIPFTLPGDRVRAKIVKYLADHQYTLADFVSVLKPSPRRNDSLVKCPYFARCSGCQFQMLSYDEQLEYKKTVVEKAYCNLSRLPPNLIPAIGETIGSPLQYGYRTKLTPHFEGPPGNMGKKARMDPSLKKGFDRAPPIGFMIKGTRKTMDIEDCPIGTDAVREGMKAERKRVASNISNYKNGATLLLRESSQRIPTPKSIPRSPKSSTTLDSHLDIRENTQNTQTTPPSPTNTPIVQTTPSTDLETPCGQPLLKTYVTDQNALITEHIGPYIFRNPAGAFFQNNNSILPSFLSYIRSHVLPPTSHTSPVKNLIDAYCGSGLFTITLSSLFVSSTGIDIAPASIKSATENARLNNIPPEKATFLTATSATIFGSEVVGGYDPDETVVIVDPPRKGCDAEFLGQVLEFGARRVVYVSCNVHTQARDVGVLVRGKEGGAEYRIESLQGFDFFPQTAHVEGVAILERVDKRNEGKEKEK